MDGGDKETVSLVVVEVVQRLGIVAGRLGDGWGGDAW